MQKIFIIEIIFSILLNQFFGILKRSLSINGFILRIAEDINGRTVNYRGNVTRGHLVNAKGSFSHAVFTLLTTGRATPFFHNGVQYRGDEDTAVLHTNKCAFFNFQINTFLIFIRLLPKRECWYVHQLDFSHGLEAMRRLKLSILDLD